jgi:hypothetical protein
MSEAKKSELSELTAMMERACEKGRAAEGLPWRDAERMAEEADRECILVGELAEQSGYTMDEVCAPLWANG